MNDTLQSTSFAIIHSLHFIFTLLCFAFITTRYYNFVRNKTMITIVLDNIICVKFTRLIRLQYQHIYVCLYMCACGSLLQSIGSTPFRPNSRSCSLVPHFYCESRHFPLTLIVNHLFKLLVICRNK